MDPGIASRAEESRAVGASHVFGPFGARHGTDPWEPLTALHAVWGSVWPRKVVFRATEGSLGAMEGALGATEGALGATEGALGVTEGSLGAAEGSLGAAEGSLGATEGSLGATEGSLRATEGSLGATEGSLRAMEGSLGATEGSLRAMEGSLRVTEGMGFWRCHPADRSRGQDVREQPSHAVFNHRSTAAASPASPPGRKATFAMWQGP